MCLVDRVIYKSINEQIKTKRSDLILKVYHRYLDASSLKRKSKFLTSIDCTKIRSRNLSVMS